MDCKPLVAILIKDVVTLSQRLQQIILKIHQYRVKIIYKPGPDICMAGWLSRHIHHNNKDEKITGMEISINTI